MSPWNRPSLRDTKTITPRTRKDVYKLTPKDLERCTIWQFALDEEGRKGQTEETLRPLLGVSSVDAGEGMYVVRTEFDARDGTRFQGYSTPSDREDLGLVQPVVVTYDGHVHFWYGGLPPTEEDLRESYQILLKGAQELFPLKFRALVVVRSGIAAGTLTGFSYLTKENEIREVT